MGTMLVRREPPSASAVRRELALDLDLHGVDEAAVSVATLVVSELVSNAIRHADVEGVNELDVTWTVSPDEILVSVEDASADVPVRRYAATDAPDGRGLAIVEALTSGWGYECTDYGKRVWANVALAPARRGG
jgi:serine/threonine-protein kinase RsbW